MIVINSDGQVEELFMLPDTRLKQMYDRNIIHCAEGFFWVHEVLDNLFNDDNRVKGVSDYEERRKQAIKNKFSEEMVELYAASMLYNESDVHRFGARRSHWQRKRL